LADRTPFWGMMTPPEVRRASLWALAGAAVAFVVAPAMATHLGLLASLMTFIGSLVALWTLSRIAIGAPGWHVGAPGEFDEREMTERHRALSLSYIIVSLGIMGLMVVGGVSRQTGFVLPPFGFAPPAVSGVLVIFGLQALPGVILAWRSKHSEEAIEADN
jgi:hypothetical protein